MHETPGIGSRILAFFIRLLPKVGPLKALAFKPPTPQTDKLFQDSFNQTLDAYRTFLAEQRANLSRTQLSVALESHFAMPRDYAGALYQYVTERRAVDYVVVTPEAAGVSGGTSNCPANLNEPAKKRAE